MSASSKKKLRNEQEAAKLTERQLAEQKEAKQLKLYTTLFVVVLAALLVIAVTVGGAKIIKNSGIRETNTVAMTIGEHEISNAELSYYFVDTLNQYTGYAAFIGLDLTKPLNEQVLDETTGETWADAILASAKETATTVYAVYDAAAAAGYTASEDVTAQVDSSLSSLELNALLGGFTSLEHYLKTAYGPAASEEGYRNYLMVSLTADEYYAAYGESLTYSDADLREAEKENFDAYSSFTYNYYSLAASRFLEGGTTGEDGVITYTDEERTASLTACEEAAKTLTSDAITSVELLDAAINGLSINAETTATSTFYEDNGYGSIPSVVAQWLSDDSRKEGDLTYLENATTDAEGNKTVNGYYVVYFHSANDNKFPLKNVRHILVNFGDGTSETGTYTDEQKAAAKAEAEAILAEFQAGSADEDGFAALATLKSDDPGSVSNGGLYENIYPGQMVPAFQNWCFDDSRKAGDTGIVETEYGYHVMYFVGNSQQNYRDFQISNSLRSADVNKWHTDLMAAQTVTDGDFRYMPMDKVFSNG